MGVEPQMEGVPPIWGRPSHGGIPPIWGRPPYGMYPPYWGILLIWGVYHPYGGRPHIGVDPQMEGMGVDPHMGVFEC